MDSRVVHHEGRDTAYHVGDGPVDDPTILYVHGEAATHAIWDRLREHSADYRMMTVDLSGRGESAQVEAEPGWETISAYTADVSAAIDEIQPRFIVGHRLGGVIAMEALGRSTAAIDGLVLLGVGLRLPVPEDLRDLVRNDREELITYLGRPGCWFHDPTEEDMQLAEHVVRSIPHASLVRDVETCYAVDPRAVIDEGLPPTLVLSGRDDQLSPPDSNRALAEMLPHGEYASIDDAANLPMVERPLETHQKLVAYFDAD